MKVPSTWLLLTLILCLTAMSPLLADGDSVQDQSFREVAGVHIDAIKSRNLDGLLATITEGEELTLIFPNGSTLYTRQEYIDFHIAWFADENWTMEIEPISYTVRGDYAVVLTRTTYTDDAGSRQAMLAMSFSQENGTWRLVFDQNTRIVSD